MQEDGSHNVMTEKQNKTTKVSVEWHPLNFFFFMRRICLNSLVSSFKFCSTVVAHNIASNPMS